MLFTVEWTWGRSKDLGGVPFLELQQLQRIVPDALRRWRDDRLMFLCADSCRKIGSISYWSLMKIGTAVFEKITTLCLETPVKDPYFCSQNIRIRRAPTLGSQKLLIAEYEHNPSNGARVHRETAFRTPPSRIQLGSGGGRKRVYPYKSEINYFFTITECFHVQCVYERIRNTINLCRLIFGPRFEPESLRTETGPSDHFANFLHGTAACGWAIGQLLVFTFHLFNFISLFISALLFTSLRFFFFSHSFFLLFLSHVLRLPVLFFFFPLVSFSPSIFYSCLFLCFSVSPLFLFLNFLSIFGLFPLLTISYGRSY